MSTNASSLEAPRNGILWLIQLLAAMLFFIAGFAKLAGDEQMVQMVVLTLLIHRAINSPKERKMARRVRS
jgi:hypothetical protein